MEQVRLALPNGHLMKDTMKTMERAGYKISGEKRTYSPSINDQHIKIRILRPQEIPIYVEEGLQDIGITGADWITETESEVETLLNLEYSTISLAVAVQKRMDGVSSLSDLLEKFAKENKNLRIATEYPNIATRTIQENEVYRKYFGDKKPLVVTPWWRTGNNPSVSVYLSFGATEAKPPIAAEAIVEVVDTGTSLRRNGLKVIEVLMESSAVLISNKESLADSAKASKIMDIMTLLKGVIDGRKKLHVFVNVKKENLNELLQRLPALKRPTISPLSDEDWVAVNTVIARQQYLKFIPILRKLAQGLVVYEPRQVLPLDSIGVDGGCSQ
ncbi:MAG: ATP phosphoribosyltransferase [Candidatus Thorarchaeota archaeon]|nr:ATP phosphoribosyltransferase [Candidatus Thorarchaeota archaeon]